VDEGVRACSGCAQALPAEAFPARGRRCLQCRRAGGREHYRRNRSYYVAKARRRNRGVIEETRRWLLLYLLDHPCVDCGNDDVRVLEFDHRDRATKVWEVSVLARNGYSLARVQEEIARCDVRCANCHRIRTHRQRGWWGSSVAAPEEDQRDQ
jgi:hypothetical protein